MIGQFIALYRARKDGPLAKRIASEIIIDGTLDRASWPLAIAKFWMVLGIVILSVLIIAFLLIGTFSHWSLATPALPLGGLIYLIIRIWRGINQGVDRVTTLIKAELGNRAENLKAPSFRKNNATGTTHQT
jgi:hypothetical protein